MTEKPKTKVEDKRKAEEIIWRRGIMGRVRGSLLILLVGLFVIARSVHNPLDQLAGILALLTVTSLVIVFVIHDSSHYDAYDTFMTRRGPAVINLVFWGYVCGFAYIKVFLERLVG